MWYRVYFLGSNYCITDVASFKASSDAAALEHARALAEERAPFIGFELWQEARPVFLFPKRTERARGQDRARGLAAAG